jgi:hypothetical protein
MHLESSFLKIANIFIGGADGAKVLMKLEHVDKSDIPDGFLISIE